MLRPEAAWDLLLPLLTPLQSERVERAAAPGRVLAAPLDATVDVPFADVSAMDGYAVGHDAAPGARLRVAGTIAAGAMPGPRLAAGTAMRIMTGAALPPGADRVVPVEETDGGEDEVLLHAVPAAGAHVRRRAEVQRRGDELLPAGERLSAATLALLASQGHGEVVVHRRPRVALLVTGDEVVAPDREPRAGQLRDTHGSFLRAALAALGATVRDLGIVGDDRDAIARALEPGLDADLLLVTGGVSKGAYDFVEAALAAHAFAPLFDGVAIQPGGPLYAAHREATGGGARLAFGLPGNPASVMVSFWLLVTPVLRRLQGVGDAFWSRAVPGVLSAPLPAAGARDRFLPALLRGAPGQLEVTPLLPRGSHDLVAYGRAEALVRVPAGAGGAATGDSCSVLPLALA